MAGKQKPLQSGIFFLELLSKGRLDPKELATHQRRIIVRHLLNERTHTSYEISELLGVHPVTVRRDIQKIKEQNAWIIDEIDERKIAVDLIQSAEVASARLFRKGNEKQAWEVQRQLVEMLQTLGYLKRAPAEFKEALTLQEVLKLAVESDENTRPPAASSGGLNGKTPNP